MATAAQRAAFLEMISPIAIRQCRAHGGKIFPSICIAMAIHESGWGTSTKMVRANALYGFKVGSGKKYGSAWKGKAYKTGTTEYYDGKTASRIIDFFRAYDTVEDSCCDYLDLLCNASRYKAALNQPTPERCIQGIISGGYATGPDYVKHIMDTVRIYDLTRYDEGDISDSSNPYKRTACLMKLGSRGESVKWLQHELNKNGASLKIDGIFGQQTKLAVLLYQKDHGLVQDGIVGKKTLLSLGVIL